MPLQFHHRQLANGLTIIAESNPDAHTSAVGFFVNAGTRDEAKVHMGVSHFLEHMMFKGTLRGRSADDVNREFDEMGANYNAYTSQENTVYYAQVLPEFLPRAVDLLGDMLRPSLRPEDFDVEKNVILEEIGMYEDRPAWRLQDTLIETHFGEHPLGYRVLGTTDSIKALPVTAMREYFGHRYSADNITVAAAGRLDFERLVAEVEKIAGAWQRTGATRQHGAPQPCPGDHRLVDAKLARHYIAMLSPSPSAQDPRRYAARVLTDVLGDDDGSRLYWALIDPGLADEADFSFIPQDGVGAYFAFASCDPARAQEVRQTLLRTIDQFADSIDEAEIDRAKAKLATHATLEAENPAGRMRGIGGQWLYQKDYTPLPEELARLTSVSAEDLRRLIREIPFTPRTVVELGPK